MTETFLEAIAYERDRRAAAWEQRNAEERRWLILRCLAEHHRWALTSHSRLPSEWLLAAEIAGRLDIPGARRLGSQARGGHSWTGYMSAALRVCPSLRHSAKLGLVRMRIQPDQRTRYLYAITPAGLDWLEAHARP